jgi:hypothetical protein
MYYRLKIYLTTTTQQNEEKESMIIIHDLNIVVLEVFRIFQALSKNIGQFFGVPCVGGCRVWAVSLLVLIWWARPWRHVTLRHVD